MPARKTSDRARAAATFARAAAAAQRRRRRNPPARTREQLERLRSLLPSDAIAGARIVELPAKEPPWTPAGTELREGETVTTFGAGRLYLARALDVWAGPGTALWFRAPGAPIFRGTRDTHTFTATENGPLELAAHPPGDWTDPSGGHVMTRQERIPASGSLCVLVVRWGRNVDSDAVLGEVASHDDSGLAAAELLRRASATEPPAGWEYLWRVGAAEIYREDEAGGVACDTERDVGILTHPVDEPLTASTRLRWSWRVDELPSRLPEDTPPTHDYLSIALEFDNGQDLTWHWSAALPAGYSYRCPLPHWDARETHKVVRTGSTELGRWLDEEVPVRADYEAAIGAPAPQRIVSVWLIAVSAFQRNRGRGAYAGIELVDGERTVRVLAGAADA